ncbi:MAG: DUF59 domain-containing protein [Bacteroidetes bacterium]|nr:DUF59 domain-containing protein [Bacteroidota bacterium]
MITQQDVVNAISKVRHPAIDFSLLELGTVKNVKLIGNTVGLEFAFPFPNIPIADQLISSIEKPIQDLGLLPVYKVTVMTEEEKGKFMEMEAQAWKGL